MREFVYDVFCVSSCEFTFRQYECFSMIMRVHVILRVWDIDQVKCVWIPVQIYVVFAIADKSIAVGSIAVIVLGFRLSSVCSLPNVMLREHRLSSRCPSTINETLKWLTVISLPI